MRLFPNVTDRAERVRLMTPSSRAAPRRLVAANDNSLAPDSRDAPTGPSFVDPSAWQGLDVPDRTWYVPDLIPSRTVTILSGDGGLGKSLIALQLGVASAVGAETMGLAPASCRVVYVGAEDELAEFHRRIDGILSAQGHSFSDLAGRFLLLPLAETDATLAAPDRAGKMQQTELMDLLSDKVAEFRPGLVVLDTSADLFGGDEIKRAQVRSFVAMLRSVAIKVDCAILLLSHPSQTGMEKGTGTSGSTAWNNSVRSRLYLTAPTGDDVDEDARVLTTMKSNYGKKGAALNLRWERGIFVVNDGNRPSPAASLLAGEADKVFLALLEKLTLQGQRVSPSPSQSYAPRLMLLQPEGKAFSKRHFVEAQQRLLDKGAIEIVEEGPASRRYKRLVVASELPSDVPSNSGFELPSNSSN